MSSLIDYVEKFIYTIKKHLSSDGFVKNVLTLMTGTTIAQAVSILISPFLRRIYTPQEFGVLALYLSLASFGTVIITGRYSIAITLPEEKDDALCIFLACIGLAFFISIISLLLIFIFSETIASLVGSPEIRPWLYLIPIKTFISGIYQTLNYWFIRIGYYNQLSRSKVIQSLTMAILNISMGLAGFGIVGLIFSIIIGEFTNVCFLVREFFRQDAKNLTSIKVKNIIIQMKRYKKFPMYSLPADIINVITSEIPNLLLSKFFGVTVVGFLSLTQRTLITPSSIISNSILDVFKERASNDYRINGNCKRLYKLTFKSLLAMSIIPFSILFLFSPQIFSFVFGYTWRSAGQYAQLLSPFFFLGFLVSPLSYMFYIAEKQIEDLILHIYMGISTVFVLYVSFIFFHDTKYVLAAYSINYSLIYLYYLGRSYRFSKGLK